MTINEWIEKLSEMKFDSNPAAVEFMDRIYPCTPPCDSFGICNGCHERSCFAVGYGFGSKPLPVLIEMVKILSEACESIIPRNVPGPQRWGQEQAIASKALARCEKLLSEAE